MPRAVRDTRYTFHTGEQAFTSLQNVGLGLDAFLATIRDDVAALERVSCLKPDVDKALACLREAFTETLRELHADAIEAADEHFESDPLAPAKGAK